MAGRIVVGVDGSPVSAAALLWAVDEAVRRDCDVAAVSVWHRDDGLVAGPLPADVAAQLAEDHQRSLGQTALDEALYDIGNVGARIRPVLAEGDPRGVLVDASADAELLVVGNRGHGAVAEALLGSVSAHCLHHAACPVVVVKEAKTG
ncbi:universal stress protein [Lentzea sp. NEAU-D7]|uniref:universal stress protein n=1 Tax=Lentzea sp. NEAU-D7 TaxID=2994667 RepID=UPI00224B4D0A|nr:universal stress protein [Lentzea sp. NEAU-D7]MCX2951456.1 universal stress protein [Lentzea sp. NEAU-D7]